METYSKLLIFLALVISLQHRHEIGEMFKKVRDITLLFICDKRIALLTRWNKLPVVLKKADPRLSQNLRFFRYLDKTVDLWLLKSVAVTGIPAKKFPGSSPLVQSLLSTTLAWNLSKEGVRSAR